MTAKSKNKLKIISRPQAVKLAKQLRVNGQKIAFTCGCFDILHAGHVHSLEQAKNFGDVLMVGLNTDASVRPLKGLTRPVNSEADRAAVLAGLASVDYVVPLSELTPVKLIEAIKPHFHVKGEDYKSKKIPEAKTVVAHGGKVVFVPLVKDKSTTKILQKIKSLG